MELMRVGDVPVFYFSALDTLQFRFDLKWFHPCPSMRPMPPCHLIMMVAKQFSEKLVHTVPHLLIHTGIRAHTTDAERKSLHSGNTIHQRLYYHAKSGAKVSSNRSMGVC